MAKRILCLLFLTTPAMARSQAPTTAAQPATHEAAVNDWGKLAAQAHTRGNTALEIDYRSRFSQQAWAAFAARGPVQGKRVPRDVQIDRYLVVESNDLPLGRLLEGSGNWAQAEAVFRRNQTELESEDVAGDDIKSDNELQLAHVLAREGKQEEANRICGHWRKHMRHMADWALRVERTNVPTPPLYDTPGVEVGRWDLACGLPDEGEHVLRSEMAAHPDMLAPHTALADYFYSEGRFTDGFKMESVPSVVAETHPPN